MTAREAYDHARAEHARVPMTYAEFWACMGAAMGRAPSTARHAAISAGWPYLSAALGLRKDARGWRVAQRRQDEREKKCLCRSALYFTRQALAQLTRQGDPRTEVARLQLATTVRELERLAAPRGGL